MNKKAKILFFCMIFVSRACFSQNQPLKSSAVIHLKTPSNTLSTTVLLKSSPLPAEKPAPFLSANYYAANLGFFCKQEIKFEKITKVPFKFRLGSVEDCDRMEGKKKSH